MNPVNALAVELAWLRAPFDPTLWLVQWAPSARDAGDGHGYSGTEGEWGQDHEWACLMRCAKPKIRGRGE